MYKTAQERTWREDFGKSYTDRNTMSLDEFEAIYQKTFGKTRSEMNRRFLEFLNPGERILEVGCNIGLQLGILRKMGFSNLWGIDIQLSALKASRSQFQRIQLIAASGQNIPFKSRSFDLVFTSGVLIHIHPENLKHVMAEIHRCSNKYIWGFEYFANDIESIKYRETDNLLWRGNYAKIFLNSFNDLHLVGQKKFNYVSGGNIDCMYLLKKESPG